MVVKGPHIFIGGISFIHGALQLMQVNIPEPFDYPESLQPFYGRRIDASTISHISNNPQLWPVFIKPRGVLKQFTGRVVKSTADLIGTSNYEYDTSVWVSEPVQFVAEWRVFVRYSNIVDVRRYKGDWRCNYNHTVIEQAVEAFKEAPKGYAMDVGLTADGRLLVVEVNEGYAIGSYGLFYVDYAKLLSARWCELTGQKDMCDF